ncbi:MAG: hypothetical protein LBV69_01215 [Bacteroidales bacterium]|jgi:hypothetical protein|nr:hypothetical protein [Bacteroidales bacterium]
MEHFKKTNDKANVYIFDRVLSSASSLGNMKSKEGLLFVCRLMKNRK